MNDEVLQEAIRDVQDHIDRQLDRHEQQIEHLSRLLHDVELLLERIEHVLDIRNETKRMHA